MDITTYAALQKQIRKVKTEVIVPTCVSAFENDAGYQTAAQVSAAASEAVNGFVQASSTNVVSSASTNDQFPSAKAVYDFIENKKTQGLTYVNGHASDNTWVSAKLLFDYVEYALELHGLI